MAYTRQIPSDDWIIRLLQAAGESILGLPPSDIVDSRFCVIGKFQEHLDAVGVWVKVDVVQQFRLSSNTVIKTWKIEPRSCMIPWSYISYVQRGRPSGQVGFVPKASK